MRVHAVCRYAERGEFILILVHVKMQVFMVLFSERNTLPTWVFATRSAGEVRSYARNGKSCADVIHFSGKTSLIHSLAGELGLDIYVVSLSSKGCAIRLLPLI